MDFFTLTIKGEPMHADRALADHGLGGDLLHDLGHEQVVRIACPEDRHGEYVKRLNEWFCEDSDHGAPYPIGSLLYWSPGTAAPPDTFRREGEAAWREGSTDAQPFE